ncbi:NYN domain-containing protein [bacterium]|nr:NYN domain-containing protein [bacterium]
MANYAFIDSQNLNLAVQGLGWKIDWLRFRRYLKDKYKVEKAYLFIGFVEKHADLYKSLQEKGYILIFKPTLRYKDGTTKGNCDAELVLQAMIDRDEYSKAVIVTGDGDFYCLVDYLVKQQKFEKLLIPNQAKYSALLKKFDSGYLAFVSDLRKKLEYTKRG